jgi:octaprenyl-diphosphate synthase
MSLQHLHQLVEKDFTAVNEFILSSSHSSVALASDLVNHLIQSGGKRLRPLLVILASRACHYQGEKHIVLATMMEFFHTATLLHDDVIDESALRRGRKTVHEIWGSKASILGGDYLFVRYMQLMLSLHNIPIMHILTDMALEVASGEIQQLTNQDNIELSESEYFHVIRSKTSLVFAVSAQASAILSEASPDVSQAMYQYGLHLGNAFQLIDDALDYCAVSDTIGKNVGDDLANGKATMPLLYAFKQGTADQKKTIKQSLENHSLDHLTEIVDIIKTTEALKYTETLAENEIQKAKAALSVLDDSPYKKALLMLADYAISRDH